jgi:hypothetical protein
MLNDLISVNIPDKVMVSETMIDGVPLSIILSVVDLVKLKIKQFNSYKADINKYQAELDVLMANGGKDEERIAKLNELISGLNTDYNNYNDYLKSERATREILEMLGPIKIGIPTDLNTDTGIKVDQILDAGTKVPNGETGFEPRPRFDLIYTSLINRTLESLLVINDNRINGGNPFNGAIAQA